MYCSASASASASPLCKSLSVRVLSVHPIPPTLLNCDFDSSIPATGQPTLDSLDPTIHTTLITRFRAQYIVPYTHTCRPPHDTRPPATHERQPPCRDLVENKYQYIPVQFSASPSARFYHPVAFSGLHMNMASQGTIMYRLPAQAPATGGGGGGVVLGRVGRVGRVHFSFLFPITTLDSAVSSRSALFLTGLGALGEGGSILLYVEYWYISVRYSELHHLLPTPYCGADYHL
ncbi:hypothetical protein BZA05DRAFT_390563 [Tricharina praecox]|uniref:uncharacterized protein n=1 Tax=Tricharina praecox TaxID=43433 RepID=UPI0022207FA1|nr:uncharacterized protein BZA05DRAFT_390563 [Tricharina praecox]KAI5856073.1 hypothetical protein BZA05DRAFT_390563 [Tricharina praecox]